MPMAQPFPLPYSRTVVRSLFGPLLPLPIPSGPEPYPSAYCLVGSCMVQALPLLELTGTGTLPARHPTPRRGAPPPPLIYHRPYFLGFCDCGCGLQVLLFRRYFCCFRVFLGLRQCFVWSVVVWAGFCCVEGFRASRLAALVGLPPSLRSVATSGCFQVGGVVIRFCLPFHSRQSFIPSPWRPYAVPSTGPFDVHSFHSITAPPHD
jgi:hypothetical protein